jgi:hypothetical protein
MKRLTTKDVLASRGSLTEMNGERGAILANAGRLVESPLGCGDNRVQMERLRDFGERPDFDVVNTLSSAIENSTEPLARLWRLLSLGAKPSMPSSVDGCATSSSSELDSPLSELIGDDRGGDELAGASSWRRYGDSGDTGEALIEAGLASFGEPARAKSQHIREVYKPVYTTTVCLSFHPMARKHVHALKGLAYRKRVAPASSPAATCKQGAALTSPARHACGCVLPSRARFGHRSSKITSNGSKT